MKATAFAPVNVAPIKYWGKVDSKLRLPANNSLSVNLSKLGTKTTVEWIDGLKTDQADKRASTHLDIIRQLKQFDLRAKVVTENNFPASTGLSSSASGFAALSLAATAAAKMKLAEKDLSRLARLGSGSACRSIPDGWVEWQTGDDQSSFAQTIFPVDHWDLRVLIVILSHKAKQTSSSDGHLAAAKSPFYQTRLSTVKKELTVIKQAIKDKDFSRFGTIMENECLNMHAVMLTGKPSLIYWLPETVRIMQSVRQWRQEGLESYFTINTGQNVFIFCQSEDEDRLVKKIKQVEGVMEVRKDKIGPGARLLT